MSNTRTKNQNSRTATVNLVLNNEKFQESESLSQGAKAIRNGKFLESQVEMWLSLHGYQVVKYKDYRNNQQNFSEKVLVKNVPFDNGMGFKGITEFCIYNRNLNKNIRIECKWQSTQGSVDGKLYEAYYNAFACDEEHVIIIVDGGGFNEQKIKNIKSLAKNNSSKRIDIVTLAEFFFTMQSECLI